MEVCISPGPLSGTVRAIPSKSQAHRALICAALADAETVIECENESQDIKATAACLVSLGASVERVPGGYRVRPIDKNKCADEATLSCGESGSTFRFLLPVAAALGRRAAFMPEGRLPERPLSPLYEELVNHGCALSPMGSVPFVISGWLTPGNYSLDAGVSSQFASGLLFALPMLGGESSLRLTGRAESFPYIELTVNALEAFGINIKFEDMTFTIPCGQTYRSPGSLNVEGDWSNAAFWLAAGAIGGWGGVACSGLDMDSKQGDRAFADILKRFGANVTASGGTIKVSGGELTGIEIDARDTPDLVPAAAVVAAAANGETTIVNAGRLRGKESDRLSSVTAMLGALGADIRETEDGLVINGGVRRDGGTKLAGGRVSSCGDHRIAMAAAVASVICDGPVVIHGAEAVGKSYPDFFADLRSLGGAAKEIKNCSAE